ncbi:MAG: hypothetical protein JW769_00175 [Parachlamydiales bacterium]|nr:hypothetical protein [Parachlamydiales bacterium]
MRKYGLWEGLKERVKLSLSLPWIKEHFSEIGKGFRVGAAVGLGIYVGIKVYRKIEERTRERPEEA